MTTQRDVWYWMRTFCHKRIIGASGETCTGSLNETLVCFIAGFLGLMVALLCRMPLCGWITLSIKRLEVIGDHGGNLCSNDSGGKFFCKKKKILLWSWRGLFLIPWITYDCVSQLKGSKQTSCHLLINTQISLPIFWYVSLLQVLAIFCASEVFCY